MLPFGARFSETSVEIIEVISLALNVLDVGQATRPKGNVMIKDPKNMPLEKVLWYHREDLLSILAVLHPATEEEISYFHSFGTDDSLDTPEKRWDRMADAVRRWWERIMDGVETDLEINEHTVMGPIVATIFDGKPKQPHPDDVDDGWIPNPNLN